MVSLFGLHMSYVELTLTSLVLLFIVSRVSLYVFHFPFPSFEIFQMVRNHYKSWFNSEMERVRSLEKISTWGVLATVFLVALTYLNVSLLAQIFELFFPLKLTVYVAILYALTEVVFSALYEYKKSRKESKFFVGFSLTVLVIFEIIGAIIRGSVDIDPSPETKTMFEHAMDWGGLGLSGVLGFIVPSAMIALGSYGMLEFVMPLLGNVFILARFIPVIVSIGFLYFFFGFTDIVRKEPDDPELKALIKKSTEVVDKVAKSCNRLRELIDRMKPLWKTIHEYAAPDLPSRTQTIVELETQSGLLLQLAGTGPNEDPILKNGVSRKKHSKSQLKADWSSTRDMVKEFMMEKKMCQMEFDPFAPKLEEECNQAESYFKAKKEIKALYKEAEGTIRAVDREFDEKKAIIDQLFEAAQQTNAGQTVLVDLRLKVIDLRNKLEDARADLGDNIPVEISETEVKQRAQLEELKRRLDKVDKDLELAKDRMILKLEKQLERIKELAKRQWAIIILMNLYFQRSRHINRIASM